MNGTAVWNTGELELVNPATEDEHQELRTSQLRITALKKLALQLVREVQSIGDVKILDIDGGLDFYREVTHFEIDLITRALQLTGGHQARAAKLLNLKGTTLNSKIKSYNIKLESLTATSGSWTARVDEIASISNRPGGVQNPDGILSGAEQSFA